MVLLVVDTQEELINEYLYQCVNFLENVRNLINTARASNVEVIYVMHDDGPYSNMTKGKIGFDICNNIKPKNNEKVFIKYVNSPFKETGLLDYLKSKCEKDIIVIGLHTDKCINAAVICGFEHDFNIIVPIEANSTEDNTFMPAIKSWQYYNKFMWPNRYARCISVDEAINIIKEKNKL